jgi:hypothetical protein
MARDPVNGTHSPRTLPRMTAMPGLIRPSAPLMPEPSEASIEDLVLATWIDDPGVYLQLDVIEYVAAERPTLPSDLTSGD